MRNVEIMTLKFLFLNGKRQLKFEAQLFVNSIQTVISRSFSWIFPVFGGLCSILKEYPLFHEFYYKNDRTQNITFTEIPGPQRKMNRHAWSTFQIGERGGTVVECRTPEQEVGGLKPTTAVLCPWARHFTPRKYWLITQEAMAPSRHDWKIVDWDVKPQHKQTNISNRYISASSQKISYESIVSFKSYGKSNTSDFVLSQWEKIGA